MGEGVGELQITGGSGRSAAVDRARQAGRYRRIQNSGRAKTIRRSRDLDKVGPASADKNSDGGPILCVQGRLRESPHGERRHGFRAGRRRSDEVKNLDKVGPASAEEQRQTAVCIYIENSGGGRNSGSRPGPRGDAGKTPAGSQTPLGGFGRTGGSGDPPRRSIWARAGGLGADGGVGSGDLRRRSPASRALQGVVRLRARRAEAESAAD